MPSNRTFIASWFRTVAEALEANDCDAESVFSEAGLSLEQTYDLNARFPVEKTFKLWKLAAKATNNSAFGLEAAKYSHPALLQGVGISAVSSTNLVEAGERLSRVSKLITDAVTLKTRQNKNSAFLEYHIDPEIQHFSASESIDAFFALHLQVMNKGSIRKNSICGFHFSRPKPNLNLLRQYEDFFQLPLHFKQPVDAIEFNLSEVGRNAPLANPALAETNEAYAVKNIAKMGAINIVDRTRYFISDILPIREPKQQDIADNYGISLRQYQRNLSALDTNFTKLLNEVRHEQAKQYLSDNELTLADITHLLGFNDQSNFTKAFKRWEGVTPNNYKKKLQKTTIKR